MINVTPSTTLKTPLLVWIDDQPENIDYEVAKAQAMGIFVVQLPSTSVAKAWVKANAGQSIII